MSLVRLLTARPIRISIVATEYLIARCCSGMMKFWADLQEKGHIFWFSTVSTFEIRRLNFRKDSN